VPGEVCPRCATRRVGAFRFCLSCGFDYDTVPTFWDMESESSAATEANEIAAAAPAVAASEVAHRSAAAEEAPHPAAAEEAPHPAAAEPARVIVSGPPSVAWSPPAPRTGGRDGSFVALGVAAILGVAALVGLLRGPTHGISASQALARSSDTPAPSVAITLPAAGDPSLDASASAPASGTSGSAAPSGLGPTGVTQTATVVKVIDGETIEVLLDHAPRVVRYLSIDVPGAPPDPIATHARDLNSSLVGGQQVILEKDVTDIDDQGRLLRHVWRIGTDGQPILVSEQIVLAGLALPSGQQPDVKYSDRLSAALQTAKDRKLGMWAAP